MQKKALNIYKWFFVIGGLYALWVLLTDLSIPCYYMETFGIQCPGCGLTRMFTSMLCLDFVSAFGYNPVMFVLFFFWNVIGILCLLEKGTSLFNSKVLWILFWGSIVVAITYGILRNFC